MKKMNLYDIAYCQVSSDCRDNIYLLLDHAGLPGLRSKLESTSLKWQSLFDNTGASSAVEAGPIVVLLTNENRLIASKRFLDWVYETAGFRSAIMMLSSPLNLGTLCACLIDRLIAKLSGELEVMLRFYDPRVFEALIKHLNQSQRDWFLNLASKWWFVNRVGEVLQIDAVYSNESQKNEKLTITQTQEDALLREAQFDQVLDTLRNHFPDLMRATSQTDQYRGVFDAIASLKDEIDFSLDVAVCRAAESFLNNTR